mmetsp:Transcript_9573/g.30635  ORF Transcript_9573/g.30635 Transcript_9573/m.30635 type:complete len:297 (-) Transcript_9573:1057-1947(-)
MTRVRKLKVRDCLSPLARAAAAATARTTAAIQKATRPVSLLSSRWCFRAKATKRRMMRQKLVKPMVWARTAKAAWLRGDRSKFWRAKTVQTRRVTSTMTATTAMKVMRSTRERCQVDWMLEETASLTTSPISRRTAWFQRTKQRSVSSSSGPQSDISMATPRLSRRRRRRWEAWSLPAAASSSPARSARWASARARRRSSRETAQPSLSPEGTSWSPQWTRPRQRTGTWPRKATSAPRLATSLSSGTPAATAGLVETMRTGPGPLVSRERRCSGERSWTTEPQRGRFPAAETWTSS